MINTLDDTDFGGKVDFCGERKTGGAGEQIEINQSQPTYEWEARMTTAPT